MEILRDYEIGEHETVLPKALVLKQHQAEYIEDIEQAIAKAEGTN